MTILILGSQGNLGSQLVKVFSADYEVVSWDQEDFDILDFEELVPRIKDSRPSLIINTIAYNNVDRCENPEQYSLALKLNVDLPARLAKLCLEERIILIHYSTDYVFSGTKSKFSFSENDIPNPLNKYGESKARGEREILDLAEQGLKYYLIRTSKLFGLQGTSPFSKLSFFDNILKLSQNRNELGLVNEELSCFTYTFDLAQATKRLWELEVDFGIYHLINEGASTWFEAGQELFRLKKINIKLQARRSEDLARSARRPKFSVLANTKIKKLRSWKEALREYLNN